MKESIDIHYDVLNFRTHKKKTQFRLLSFIVLACLVIGLTSCTNGCSLYGPMSDDEQFVIMTYNVQNVFDGIVDGTEYVEFTPEKGWSGSDYATRLERVYHAVIQEPSHLPDVIVFQEIEHERVLEDFTKRYLLSKGFSWIASTQDMSSPIQTGIVSRHPIISAINHGTEKNRSVLEVVIESSKAPIVIFAVHAKSKREGAEETEHQRIRTITSIKDAVQAREKIDETMVMCIAGDFNESADEFYRNGSSYQTALIPTTAPGCNFMDKNGSLPITGSIPADGQWYSWWLDRDEMFTAHAEGSYWYNGIWETFDQVLLNDNCFDGNGWEYVSGQVVATKYLSDANGKPFAWDAKSGKGYSDHLPVYVLLEWSEL